MRSIRILGVSLILAAILAVLWWRYFHRVAENHREDFQPQVQGTNDAESLARSGPSTDRRVRQSASAATVSTSPSQISSDVKAYVRKSMADPLYDWKQPINFYGIVLDEDGEPVEGATVHFKWNDLSAEGTSASQATSDADGKFSLLNRTGKRLSVQVHKGGYYNSRRDRAAFEYANPADRLFTPDAEKPVVFHLRRKGAGTALITSKFGVKEHLGVIAPLDGTPVMVDLLSKTSGSGGQLAMSQYKPDYEAWQQATQWWFRMEIPDGGFFEHDDEFPFEAPEAGYEPVVRFDFQQGQTNWATRLSKDYYVRFGNPPRYGRLHVETEIIMEGARLTYAINPSGSRYLEAE